MAISEQMKDHLKGTITLAVFLKIIAPDGDQIRLWNGTKDKLIDGELYIAFPVTPSQVQTKKGLEADNLEIVAAYAEEVFTSKKLRSQKWVGARIEYRTMNYRDPSMGYLDRRVGFIGEAEVGRFASKVEVKSLSSKLGQTVGRVYTKDCDCARLGDARCRVDLSGTTVDGFQITADAVITAAPNRQQFSVNFADEIKPGVSAAPANLYERGEIEFLTGDNAGRRMLVYNNLENEMTLFLPVFFDIKPGDQVRLTVGCNRRIEICRGRFNNAENFQGFYTLPGRTRIFTLPS